MPLEGELARLALAAAAGLAGWWTGGAPARLVDALLALLGTPPRQPARDRLVQGGVAASWAVLVCVGGLTWPVAAAALLAIPLVQVGVTDWRQQDVYTAVAACGLVAGLLLGPTIHGGSGWMGLVGATLGLLSLAAISAAVRLACGGRAIGRGDLVIAAMVGAIAGPEASAALASGALVSGLYASLVVLAGRPRTTAIPYGPGLCLGGLLSLVMR
jgi:prepilin signal peptidase PulO-like enzyme (type II secretory pathway)